MSFVIEENKDSVAVIKMQIPKEPFLRAVDKVYEKQKGRFSVPGFRKGKAPKYIIEARYGKEIFYDDALDEAFAEVYPDDLAVSGLQSVASPRLVSIDQVGEEGALLTIELALKPEFELADYSGIKIGSLKYTSKKADAEEEMNVLLDKNSRMVSIEDEESIQGDILSIDFEGFIDGEAFEGGKAENYTIAIGSNTFIPGFEEQLAGRKAGEKFEVKVTFPEEYGDERFNAKDAVFETQINSVKRKELPVLDDEFALDLGFNDLKALEKDVKAKLKQKKEAELRSAAEQKILDELVSGNEITIAPRHIAETAAEIKRIYEERLRERGVEPEDYYSYMLQMMPDEDENYFQKMFVEQAVKDIKTELITTKIIETENIEAAEEDVNEEYKIYAENYGMPLEEFIAQIDEPTQSFIQNTITQKKMLNLLIEKADTSKK